MFSTIGIGLLIVIFVGTTTAQDMGYDCCTIYMMDTRGRVVIETRRQLTPGIYVAVRIRACTTDPIAVQIWRRIDNSTFLFRWQTVIYPVLSRITRTYMTVNLNTALTITNDDRLGLFSPANSSNLATPYGFDEASNYLYYSSTSFDSFSSFTGSLQVTTDDLRWPRSFNGSVFFCRLSDCSDAGQDVPQSTSPYTPFLTGATPRDQCCANQMTCNMTGLDIPLWNQSDALDRLNREVNEILELIRNLMSNRVVTGICPQGFTAGTYGVGKCYLMIRDEVPMAVAALRCQTEFNAVLIQIKNIIEDSFLRNWLSNVAPSGDVSFWTAGMYNFVTSNWFWYDEASRIKSSMLYTNWLNRVSPVPTSDADVCAKLVVHQGPSNSSYWMKDDCNKVNFFICQVAKICL